MRDLATTLPGFGTQPLAGVAVPVAIVPTATTTMSAEAAALLAQFHDVARRFNATDERLDEADKPTVCVEEPEELFARGHDFFLLNCIAHKKHWNGERRTYGSEELISELRKIRFGSHEVRGRTRRDEIVEAWDRWRADEAAAEEASGEAAARALYQTVGDQYDAFMLRLTNTQTVDPDIIRIKVAAVFSMYEQNVEWFDRAIDSAIEDVVKEEGEHSMHLCFSLMRDMVHQIGAVYRVPT